MSRRKQIRMSEGEISAFLRGHKTMILVSNGSAGHPHPMPMWFVVDEDNAIRMTTFRKSQKVKNLRRDPRVALLVESGEEYSELMGVVLYGKCEIIDDIEVVTQTLIDAASTGPPSDDPKAREATERVLRKTAEKRVCLRIVPERIVSWDHRKLGGRY